MLTQEHVALGKIWFCDRGSICSVYVTVREHSEIKNILICVLNMNKGTTWGWVIHDRIFIFGWTISLKTARFIHKFQVFNTFAKFVSK